MTRNAWNGLIDLGLALLLIGLILTGLGMAYVIPQGQGHGVTLWGLSRHGWGDLHLWMGYGLVAMVALHLALHWGWVLITARRAVRPEAKGCPSMTAKLLTGAGTVIVLVALLLTLGSWARSSLVHDETGRGWQRGVGVVQPDSVDHEEPAQRSGRGYGRGEGRQRNR